MLRILGLLLALLMLTIAALVADDGGVLGLATLAVVCLIVGFAVVAAAWTIRHDV